jgi:hypothetical protein
MDTIFFSYSRVDSSFVLRLAKDLRDAGINIWLDQMDIKAGSHWDSSIEKALHSSKTLIIVLSKTSVASENVMDEVSYALEEGKRVIPILLNECDTPFRLRRLQRIDFTGDYKTGFANLLETIGAKEEDKSKQIESISDRIKGTTEIKQQIEITKQSKKGSKKYIVIVAAFIVLSVVVFVLLKNNGNKKEETKVAAVSTNTPAPGPEQGLEFDENAYYFLINKDNSKVMAVMNGYNGEEGVYEYIVVVDTADMAADDWKKIQITQYNDKVMLWAKHSDKWFTIDADGLLIQNGNKEAEGWQFENSFRIKNYDGNYFQIESLYKNGYVVGLQKLSANESDGQKVIITENDNSPQTQWKLIPTGEKAVE